MKITIETIPHNQQRIPGQAGDWQWQGDDLVIRVSELPNPGYVAALGIHEMVEAIQCRRDGVSEEDVDAFDKGFAGEGEAGDDSQAPYRRQHKFATSVEMKVITMLELSWTEYEKAINAL